MTVHSEHPEPHEAVLAVYSHVALGVLLLAGLVILILLMMEEL